MGAGRRCGSTQDRTRNRAQGVSRRMCGIVGYVGPREARPLLLAGLEKLEYRGYDSAGISVLDGDRIDAVRAVGNLSALRSAIDARDTVRGRPRWRSPSGREPGDRDRPHALGDPRPGQRGERPSALRHRRPRPHRRQRDRRELRRAQGAAARAEGARVHLRDRRRGDRPPRRPPHTTATSSTAVRDAYAELRGHYAFVAMSADRARPARRRAQGVPADRRPRRRRAVHRLGDPGVPARDPRASSTSTTTSSSSCAPRASSS